MNNNIHMKRVKMYPIILIKILTKILYKIVSCRKINIKINSRIFLEKIMLDLNNFKINNFQYKNQIQKINLIKENKAILLKNQFNKLKNQLVNNIKIIQMI